MGVIYTLEKRIKPKKGLLYLLRSSSGVYKFGATRGSVKTRASWATRKMSEHFEILETKIVKKPFKTESNFMFSVVNGVDVLDGCCEFFTLKKDGLKHVELLQIFGEVDETKWIY